MTSRDARGRARYIPFTAVPLMTQDGPLRALCGYNGGAIVPVEARGVPMQALVAFVSGGCFDTFGIAPILGRGLTDGDAPLVTAGSRVVVIGHRFWTRAFDADPAAVGQTIRTDGVEAVIVGVLPEGFGGLQVDTGIDVFAPPDSLIPARADRRPVATEVLGRLRHGVTLAQAQAAMAASWPRLLQAALPPDSDPLEGEDLWGASLRLESMGTGLSGLRTRYAPAVLLIFAVTTLLLLVACVNLGALLLTRVSARATELSLRLALGGSRGRIAQQMLVESLILSMSGAALALPLSMALTVPLVAFIPPALVPPTISFAPDARVLLVTGLLGVVVALLMAAIPLAVALRRQGGIRIASARTIAGAAAPWTRTLLIAQVAMSVVLVVGAGLLARSLYLLRHADLGVRTEGVLRAKLMPIPNRARAGDAGAYRQRLLARVAALPGVRAAGYSQIFPNMTVEPLTAIAFAGEALRDLRALSDSASPEYFDAMGIRLLAGRLPSWSDTRDSRAVAVVSNSLARALAPDGEVLERRVRFGTNRDTQDIVIVGIVADATIGNARRVTMPVLYFPPLQRGGLSSPSLLIATAGGDVSVAAAVRGVVEQEGREYAHEITTVDELFARAPSTERMSATVAGWVAGLAVLLALVGVHGALGYSVSRRTREIGVRVALGAAPGAVAAVILREGMIVAVSGVLIGMPLAILGARALRSLLFGVSEAEPLILAATALLFAGLGMAAGAIPAGRAASVDPVVALRAE